MSRAQESLGDVRDVLRRPLRDLRLSVIDACNFRCPYCMPADRLPDDHGFDATSRLSFGEMETLVRGFVLAGVTKLRLTGGEPLLRKRLPDLVARMAAIKGLGGALTREKIVAAAARRFVLIVDTTKVVDRLADAYDRVPVPIEVLSFGWKMTAQRLAELGSPVVRQQGGAPYQTDSGNLIYDLGVGPIDDPRALDARLQALPGVVETGLFLGRADVVIVASAGGIGQLTR